MSMSALKLAKLQGRLVNVESKDIDSIEKNLPQHLRASLEKNVICLHPNTPDEEIADREPDELARIFGGDEEDGLSWKMMHARLLEFEKAEIGSGSWPVDCHPKVIEGRHVSLVYVYRETYDNSHYNQKVTDSEIQTLIDSNVWGSREYVMDHVTGMTLFDAQMWFAMECFRLNGCYHEYTEDKSEANVLMSGKYLPGYSGVAWFNNGRCSDQVKLHTDNTQKRGLSSGAWLNGHELGHTNRLYHEFSGERTHRSLLSYQPFTSPFVGISLGKDKGWPIPLDPIKSKLLRFYGDEVIPRPGEDPDDPPPPPPPNQEVDLAFVLDGKPRYFKEIKR